MTATPMYYPDSKQNDAGHESVQSPPSADLAGLFWINQPKCDSVYHDLPIINSPFVGREVEMNKVIHYINTNTAHIININGAPGFGKSLLVIHVGYEMLKQGSTVRYIDAFEKFLSSSIPKEHTEEQAQSKQRTMGFTNSKAASLAHPFSSAMISNIMHDTKKSVEHTNDVVEKLLTWSENINCHTVLILDNCDDLIYDDVTRENLIELVKLMIQNANNLLHVIITSHQVLYILDDFESLVVKELSKAASARLLSHMAPNISLLHSEEVVSLLEGCPLALKVVGMLLHKQEDRLSEILQKELQQHPIQVLDKVSTQRERFGAIMDVVYEHLGYMQECGYYISLFPGSFAHQTGSKTIPIHNCLETFVEHSLLDRYHVVDQTRYKMHRLIREYFKEKGNHSLKFKFEKNYCDYFTNYILRYANLVEVTERDQYLYSTEIHNIHHFLNYLVLPKEVHTTKELTVMAYAIGEGLIPVHSVKDKFYLMVEKISQIYHYMQHKRCDKLFSYVIHQLYLECRCTDTFEYFKQVVSSPCMNWFRCQSVAEIYKHPAILQPLDKRVRNLLHRIQVDHCEVLTGMHSYLMIYYGFDQLITIPFAVFSVLEHFSFLLILHGNRCRNIVCIIYFVLVCSLHLIYALLYLSFIHKFVWMEWMTEYFPHFTILFKNSVFFIVLGSVLYARYKRRTVQICNVRLEYQFPNYKSIIFTLIIVLNCCLDVFIFLRLVPFCY